MASNIDQLAANTIRALAMDGVQKANSGHPGMPMGMADCAHVLWSRYLRFNPKDPAWANRDRFILSPGHGSMLLYALLHLAGYDVSMDDLMNFRQWGSRTAGHPEFGQLPGVETTTGPLGQGFANGVGMALGQKIMADRFNTGTGDLINHRIFAIVSDGDLMEGVAAEAASLAGHLRLGNLIYFYDDNHITIEGDTDLAFSEDVPARFGAYGWHTLSVDGHNHEQIDQALAEAINETERPSLISAKTYIAYGSPHKQDSASSHGSPLGIEEVRQTKEQLDLPGDKSFWAPDAVMDLYNQRISTLKIEYDAWQKKYNGWRTENQTLAEMWDAMHDPHVDDDLEAAFIDALPDKDTATRVSGGKILQKAAALFPGLLGGSADLAPSTKTWIEEAKSIQSSDFSGRNIHFGIREHGMGGILNGLALYGGFIPYGSTFLVFSDYMRPSIRLAALMKIQVISVFTHDSIFVGEDGPTHQPVEHVAALRAIPNLDVFRPADDVETAAAWTHAIRRKDGPTTLCLTRQTVPHLRRDQATMAAMRRGGYILQHESGDKPDVVLVATGSEVSAAVEASHRLVEDGRSVRIVSMPCIEVFRRQSEAYQASVIPDFAPVVVIEAGIEQGWGDVMRSSRYLFIGKRDFGASAPFEVLAEKFGLTGEKIADRVVKWL